MNTDYTSVSVTDLIKLFEWYGYEFCCDGDKKKYYAVADDFY